MLPILDKVQFPWRTLMLIEFCVVTKLSLDPRTLTRPVALLYPVMLAAIIIQPPVREDLSRYPDATEYLPPARNHRADPACRLAAAGLSWPCRSASPPAASPHCANSTSPAGPAARRSPASWSRSLRGARPASA